MVQIASLVLFSANLTRAVSFYRAIGLDLEEEDHGDGPVHFATEVDSVHFALFGTDSPTGRSPSWRQPGSSFAGFYVTSLPGTLAAVREQDAPVLVDHQVRPWGCRAVVEDPDGRAVEINQRDHCGAGGPR